LESESTADRNNLAQANEALIAQAPWHPEQDKETLMRKRLRNSRGKSLKNWESGPGEAHSQETAFFHSPGKRRKTPISPQPAKRNSACIGLTKAGESSKDGLSHTFHKTCYYGFIFDF